LKAHNDGKYPMPAVQIPGWTTANELEWLYLRATENRIIVEVGCAYGRSSHALLTGNFQAFGNEGKVYCVDPWPMPCKDNGRDEFDPSRKCTERRTTFFLRCGHFPNLNVWEMTSYRAHFIMMLFDIKPDMVFLDPGTINMMDSLVTWRHYARFLCGHDYSEKYPELKSHLEFDGRIRFVEGTSIWYVEEDYWE